MARMPGAEWRPLPSASTTPMARYDLFLIHTMVGTLEGTDGYFRSGRTSSNSHFGVGAYGVKRQWVDTAVRSAANGAGNHRSITSENEDMGPRFGAWNTGDGNAVPALTPEQVEANAQLAAWAHVTHGVPLVPADTSRPNARGVGYHRLGCNPWRVSDGELWSSANGKVCPGPRRIAQIPQIIARAKQIVAGIPQEDDMSAEAERKIEAIWQALFYNSPTLGTTEGIGTLVKRIDANVGPIQRPGDPWADDSGMVSLRQEVADIKTTLAALVNKLAPEVAPKPTDS